MAAGIFCQAGPQAKSLPQQYFAGAKPSDFVGEAKCAECHVFEPDTFSKSPHAAYVHNASLPIDRQGCEACHGPARIHTDPSNPGTHILDYPKLKPSEVVDACLRCHGDVMKKPHFEMQSHARAGLSCISCHQIHPKQPGTNPVSGERGLVIQQVYSATKESNPMLKSDEAVLCATCHKPEITDFRKNSHHPVAEGRMICSDCHSIHPTNADRLKQSKLKDACVTCHAEVAGPFVYEHDPVAGWTGGGCVECHNPHGSNNPSLLSSSSRGLCAQCHTDKGGANHFPGQSCWASGCHVAVHGSNHDVRLLSK